MVVFENTFHIENHFFVQTLVYIRMMSCQQKWTFKITKYINDLPTCVTDHSLNNDVHEEAVVVC